MNRDIYIATNSSDYYVLIEAERANEYDSLASVVKRADMPARLSRFANTLKHEVITEAREAVSLWNDIAWLGGEPNLALDEDAMYLA